ncbi:E3 ubiquitin-protein ligase listerin-like, partial [Cryptotermes secundus]|uniref:E3 ubiquitin-protein ligase listerin-like n=1 Tax=Cryptotermes secundus TaxID=105785 RepID=UPI001454DCD7
MAYFLLWTVILEMCGLAIPELRYQYATFLRNSGFLRSLLQNVFRLMPVQVLQGTDPKYKVHKASEMFTSPPSLAFSQAYSSEMLEYMSCWVYCSALQRLPALVRQWWSELEPKVASLVEQVISVHCAPLLCAQEMKVIQSKDMHHGNMLVINTTTDTNQGCYKCLG